jgi:hypothetical protein
MLHLFQAMLGLYPDAARERLNIIRPRLPYWLRQVHISGLRVGRAHVDLHFSTAQGVTSVAVETRGRVTVVTSSSWRLHLSNLIKAHVGRTSDAGPAWSREEMLGL